MFNIIRKEINWNGRTLTLETGKIARQADGAVVATCGETSVMTTVVMSRTVREGADYFPLNVHYKEMFFAAGKIPGGFMKREGRPSDREVLVSRLIDRPMRPLFPEGFYNEVQILSTVLSYDGEINPDILALVSASAALAISGIPFHGSVAAARVGKIDGAFVLNPTVKESEVSELDLVVAGTKDSIMMVEAGAQELSEEDMLEAMAYAQQGFAPVIQMIEELKAAAGKPRLDVEMISFDDILVKQIKAFASKDLERIFRIADKKQRGEEMAQLKIRLLGEIDTTVHSKESIRSVLKTLEERIVRKNILDGIRIDGRDNVTIRPIATEVSLLPRTHGSALFTRGETQVLAVTTLGSSDDEQIVDSMARDGKDAFMLHYNFGAYSVGEAGPQRSAGRREIGHGRLALKAINQVLPSKTDFPYTIRVVAEVTESNGSSSMATVCSTTLSLMDAGVPIKKPVAGIAMGLIKDEDKFVILTDIIADEDNLGDMDFKVARTSQGIVALQMDIKTPGITMEIIKASLTQAKEGLSFILDKLSESLEGARQQVSQYAPSITKITISKDKIGALIGPGGKMIKEICEKTGAKIDIDDSGVVSISAIGREATDAAIRMVNNVAFDLEIGPVYDGVVKQVLDFGAVVSVLSKEGLVHISEMSAAKIQVIHDFIKVGDQVKVKVLNIDKFKGKIRLSMKAVESQSQPDNSCNNSKSSQPGISAEGECNSKTADAESEDEGEINYNRADSDIPCLGNRRMGGRPEGRPARSPRPSGGGTGGFSGGGGSDRKKFFTRPKSKPENKKKYFTT